MPPKVLTAAQRKKELEKLIKEKTVEKDAWNTFEFKRLNQKFELLMQQWNGVAQYCKKQDLAIKHQLNAESLDFNTYLLQVSDQYQQETEMLKLDREWQHYLKTFQQSYEIEDFISAINSLLKAIQHDSTVDSITLNLSEIPTLRPYIEGKQNLYEIYIAIIQRIIQELQQLEKFTQFIFPFQQQMQGVIEDVFKQSTIHRKTEVGEQIVLNQLEINTETQSDIFAARQEFKIEEQQQDIIQRSLDQKLIQPNPPPKAEFFEPPKEEKKSAKDAPPPPPKKKRKIQPLQPQLEVSDDLVSMIGAFNNRLLKFELFIQQNDIIINANSNIKEIEKDFEDQLLKESGKMLTDEDILVILDAKDEEERLAEIAKNGGKAPKKEVEPVLKGKALKEKKAQMLEEQKKRISEYRQDLKEQRASLTYSIQQKWKQLDVIPAPVYVSNEELKIFKQISLIQRQRVLLRCYLVDILDLSYKSLLDNQEVFVKTSGESVHFTHPKIYNDFQFNDNEESDNASEGDEDSDEGEVEHKKKKGGLNSEVLQKHNQMLQQSQKLEESKTEQVEEEEQQQQYPQFDVSQTQRELMKLFEFRNTSNPDLYNKVNITSINEYISSNNHDLQHPSLRDGFKLANVPTRHDGDFLVKLKEKDALNKANILAELCRTDKVIYTGSSQTSGQFYIINGRKVLFDCSSFLEKLRAQERKDLKQNMNQVLEQKKEEEQPKPENQENILHLHEQNFIQSIWMNGKQGNRSTKVSFDWGKLSLNNAGLTAFLLSFNLINLNITGNYLSEVFDQIRFKNLPVLNFSKYIPEENFQSVGSGFLDFVFKNGINYVKKQTITNPITYVDAEAEEKAKKRIENFNILLKKDHVNIQALGQLRDKLMSERQKQQQMIDDSTKLLFTSQIYYLDKVKHLENLVRTVAAIDYLGQELKLVDFKVIQEFYNITKLQQKNEIDLCKKKKQKSQKLEANIKENCQLLSKLLHQLDPSIHNQVKPYFHQELELLRSQQQVKKGKSKKKQTFEVFTADQMYEIVNQPETDEYGNEIQEMKIYKIPQIVPVGPCYLVDLMKNQTIQHEANGWNVKVLQFDDVNTVVKNHQSDYFDGDEIDQQETVEQPMKYRYINPVKAQIKLFREQLAAKSRNRGQQLTNSYYDLSSEKLNKTSIDQRASLLIQNNQYDERQYYRQINLFNPPNPLKPNNEVLLDQHVIYDEIVEVDENFDNTQVVQVKELLDQNQMVVEHVQFPVGDNFKPFPQSPVCKISQIAEIRAKNGVFDSTLLWNYAPNVSHYQKTVMDMQIIIEGADGTEQVQQQQAQIQQQQQKVEAYVNLDIQLSPELRAGIKQIMNVNEAIMAIKSAMISREYVSLSGKYFVCVWNVATNSFDLDGVEKMEYKQDSGILSIKVTKIGVIAICSLKQASLPYRGWAIIPDSSRGEGYDIQQAAVEFDKFVGDIFQASMKLSIGMDQSINTQAQVATDKSLLVRSRYSYFQPHRVMQRTGNSDDVPVRLQNTDIQVPFFLERAIRKQLQENVCVHSVLLKLLLPSNILLTIRVLPDGYEVVELRQLINLQEPDSINAYADYQEFLNQAKISPSFQSYKTLPQLFKNIIFQELPDLMSALARSGILLNSTESDDEIGIKMKHPKTDVEFARQVSAVAAASSEGGPLVSMLTHSPWNRNLPDMAKSYPERNEFQDVQTAFDEAQWMSKGYILPRNVPAFMEAKRKRQAIEKRQIKKYMAENNVDEKTAAKTVVKKADKQEKGALGPGPYGYTDQVVDMRSDALKQLEDFVSRYLNAVDDIRQVEFKDAAAFIIHSNRVKFEQNNENQSVLEYYQTTLQELQVPQSKGERPVVPELKKPKKKKGQAVVQVVEKEIVDVRCDQNKAFIPLSNGQYTACVNKVKNGDQYTIRLSCVPLDGPEKKEEQFCNQPLPQTVAHAGAFGLFGLKAEDVQVDAMLQMKLFELLVILKLGTLG